MNPKLALLISVLGFPHCGVFTTLVAFARICSLKRSLISNVRYIEASRFQKPGPLITFLLRLPNSGLPPFSVPARAKHPSVVVSVPEVKEHFVFLNQGLPG